MTAAVTWIGAPGTFGPLASVATTPSGHTLATSPVTGWGFGPGECLFYSLPTGDGKIILSTVPLTMNELLTTTDHAEINVYDPVAGQFYSNTIPTSLGFLRAVKPSFLTGGTDVGGGDLCITPDGRVLFTCTGYDFGWSTASVGLYPAIGFLVNSNGMWVYDNGAESKNSNQLEATNPTAWATISSAQTSGYYPTRGINQVCVLPKSGNIAIGHYFGNGSFNSGVISVWDKNGNLQATYQIPSCNRQDATTAVEMSPRELKSDPTSSVNDERILVVYDVFGVSGNGTPTPSHVLMEFSYNAGAQTITPLTCPFVAADTNWAPGASWFDPAGTLYVSGGPASGGLAQLNASNMAVWVKNAATGNRAYVAAAPATGAWATNGSYATGVIPDWSLGTFKQQGTGGAAPLAMDPATWALLYPGLYNGKLAAVVPSNPVLPAGSVSVPNLIPGAAGSAPYGFGQANGLQAQDALLQTASNVGNWRTAFASCTVAWTASASCPSPVPGIGNALALTAITNGSLDASIAQAGWLPVTGGQKVGFSAQFIAAAGTPGQTVSVLVSFYNASLVNVGNTTTFTATDNGTGYTTVSGFGNAPSTAVWAQLTVGASTTTIGQEHFAANFTLEVMAVPAGWAGFVTTLSIDNQTVQAPGGFSLALTAPFNQGTVFASGPLTAVSQGTEYLASGWVRAKTGSTTGACFLQIAWYASDGVTQISTTGAGNEPTSSTSSWQYLYVGGLAPPGAVWAKWEVTCGVANTGDTDLISEISLIPQPWTAVPQMDTGMQERRNYDGSTMSPGRPSIIGGTLYIPVQNSFTPAQQSAYTTQQLSAPGYAPDTVHPQFLLSIPIGAFLGLSPPPPVGLIATPVVPAPASLATILGSTPPPPTRITYTATDLVTGKVTASNIPLEVQSFTQQLNGGGTLSGNLDLQAAYLAAGSTATAQQMNEDFIAALEPERCHLWVLANGYPIWDGVVWDWPDQSRGPGKLPITASTIDSILAKRLISANLTYGATLDIFDQVRDLVRYALTKTSSFIASSSPYTGPASPLVAAQCAVAGLKLGGTTKAGATWPASYLWSDLQSVADALTTLVQAGNLEFYFQPGLDANGNLITTLTLGYTTAGRPYPQARYSVTYPGSASDYGYPRTASQGANYVWATATPNGNETQWTSAYPHGADTAQLLAGYPLIETTVAWDQSVVNTQSQVNAFADGQVTLLTQQQTAPVIVIPDGAAPNVRDLVLGDTFPFAATSPLHPAQAEGTPGYQELVRLIGWTFFPPGPSQTAYMQLQTSAITQAV